MFIFKGFLFVICTIGIVALMGIAVEFNYIEWLFFIASPFLCVLPTVLIFDNGKFKESIIPAFYFVKRIFVYCDHKDHIFYDGINGGMGFLWRKFHCENCMKKGSHLTCTSPFDDRYVIGQKLNKDDLKGFDNEVF